LVLKFLYEIQSLIGYTYNTCTGGWLIYNVVLVEKIMVNYLMWFWKVWNSKTAVSMVSWSLIRARST